MKKIISIVLMLCAFAFVASALLPPPITINYYVATTGDDANDGLTEVNAFATIETAIDSAQARFNESAVNNDFVINVGAGTYNANENPMFTFVNSSNAITFKFLGAGAGSTTLQGGVSYPSSKRFANLGDANDNLIFYFENIHLDNFGNNYSGGLFNLNGTNRLGVEVYIDNCKVTRLRARQGGLIFTKSDTKVAIANSYLADNVTMDYGNFYGSPIEMQRGELTLSNCVFDSNISTRKTKQLNVGVVAQMSCAQGNADVSIVNNTFVNNAVTNASAITWGQGCVYINGASGKTCNLEFANNILCGNTSDGPVLYDVLVKTNSGTINFNNCTNNVMNSQSGFSTANNSIDPSYTYISPELSFAMDGAVFDYDTTSVGVPYMTARGTLVVEGALASVQTATDIVGTTRLVSGGCVGAVEYALPSGSQFITFGAVDPVLFSEASDITLAAIASSGLSVTYVSSNTAVATVVGNVLTPVGEGKAIITASQAGDDSFDPAESVDQEVYFAPDTVTYFVRAEGDNSADGLTEATAVASHWQALLNAKSEATALTYVIDVDGTVTTNPGSNLTIARDENTTYILQGDDASTDILQLKTDEEWATSKGGGRMMNIPSNTGSGSMTFEYRNLTFRNMGQWNNWNGGILINATASGTLVDVEIENCNILRSSAHGGAVLHLWGGGGTLTMKDSYVGEMITYGGGYVSPIKIGTNGSAAIENCVFADCVKNNGSVHTNSNGSVLAYVPTDAASSLSLVNNTFIGDSILDPDMTVAQSVVYIMSTVENTPVTIANNVFVGNASLAVAQDFYDVYVDATSSALAITNSTNNVMTSQLGLGATGNFIDPTYTYVSEAINFTMDGDYPELFTTTTGVSYVKANGDSVFQKGLANAAFPTADIAGTPRATNPCVGAFEALQGRNATALDAAAVAADVALYPSPVQDLLYIKGDVVRVAIYSVAGIKVKSAQYTTAGVDVSTLNSGIYIVKCEDAQGASVAVKRIMKK